MNDAKSQVMNVQRQYNDYLDQLAHDGVEKYSDEQQQQINTYESSLKERKQAYIKAADAVIICLLLLMLNFRMYVIDFPVRKIILGLIALIWHIS